MKLTFTQLFSGTLFPFFFWWLPHSKWSSAERVPSFSRVTEQLSLRTVLHLLFCCMASNCFRVARDWRACSTLGVDSSSIILSAIVLLLKTRSISPGFLGGFLEIPGKNGHGSYPRSTGWFRPGFSIQHRPFQKSSHFLWMLPCLERELPKQWGNYPLHNDHDSCLRISPQAKPHLPKVVVLAWLSIQMNRYSYEQMDISAPVTTLFVICYRALGVSFGVGKGKGETQSRSGIPDTFLGLDHVSGKQKGFLLLLASPLKKRDVQLYWDNKG